MLNGFGWSDIEGGPAERCRVGADYERNLKSSGTTIRPGLVIDVEDVYPVDRVSLMVIKQAPRAIRLFPQFWCAKERLPGVPHRLR